MATPHDSLFRSPKEMLDTLAAARSNARMRVHLLSLEARDRLHELESRLERLQTRIETDGERATETAAKRVRELTQSMRELLREQRDVPELQVPVHEIMSPARTCSARDTLSDAARIMWETDCGSVPVVNDDKTLVGLLTDRDVCMAAFTRGLPLSQMTVDSTMVKDLQICAPTDRLQEVTALMRQHRIRRVPVVDRGRLVGVVALADVARQVEAGGFNSTVANDLAFTLTKICEPRPTEAASSAAQ